MRLVKSLLAALLITAFAIVTLLGMLLFINRLSLRKFLIRTTSFFSNLLLIVLDITTINLYSPSWKKDKSYLILSNHLSYIDILVIASIMPSVFVSSMEVKANAFLGFLTGCGGSLFIERRKKAHLKREIKMLSDTLNEGFNVVVFPEGTSSSGETVLPFKKSLMETAFISNCDVLPVCLRYWSEDDKLLNPSTNPVHWFGDMTFLPHFFNLLKQTDINVTMQVMEPLSIGQYESRIDLAEDAYNAISTAYRWKAPSTPKSNHFTPHVSL
jgi:1-acyl-sn-glycerol-3-phosphate acyltransferase